MQLNPFFWNLLPEKKNRVIYLFTFFLYFIIKKRKFINIFYLFLDLWLCYNSHKINKNCIKCIFKKSVFLVYWCVSLVNFHGLIGKSLSISFVKAFKLHCMMSKIHSMLTRSSAWPITCYSITDCNANLNFYKWLFILNLNHSY